MCLSTAAGDSEETQETARLPELPGPEPGVRAHVLPRDGVPAPEDHVAQLVRAAPSLRGGQRAAGARGRRPRLAVSQDGHLHGPVQISRLRRVPAATDGASAAAAAAATAAAAR